MPPPAESTRLSAGAFGQLDLGIDLGFKVVKQPFSQLLSIHCFIKHGDCLKQVPLVYVMMSSRRKDYIAVFSAVKELVPNLQVKEVVMDFESGMWAGIRATFPDVAIKGCVFHWTQAVWRHVQSLGLQQAYSNDEGTHTFIRKLMALPFVPHEYIPMLFLNMTASNEKEMLRSLTTYVYNTWINSSVWPSSTWCVFCQQVRTNNDVEGWHHRLNHKAGRGQIQMYLLIDLLHSESKYVEVQTSLVRNEKMSRTQRSDYRKVNEKIQGLWDDLHHGDITTVQLLAGCSKIYGPVEDTTPVDDSEPVN